MLKAILSCGMAQRLIVVLSVCKLVVRRAFSGEMPEGVPARREAYSLRQQHKTFTIQDCHVVFQDALA